MSAHDGRSLAVAVAGLAALALVAVGVAAMFALSAVGGVGGRTGRSVAWGLVVLPYPAGLVLGLVTAVRLVRERWRARTAEP